MTRYKPKEIRSIADFNPPETLKVNTTAKKIPMGHLQTHQRKITGFETATYKSGPKFRNGDVLLAKITPCLENGKTALVDILDDNEVAFGSSEFIVLRAKNNSDNKFLYYLAKSPAFRKKAIGCMEGTSGRKRVNENVLKLYELPIPEKKIQTKIAVVLSSIDNKIELNNRINAELEAMAKTLYDYWYVQFEFPDANGNPYKTSGGKMVYNTTLKREIPEGWSSITVGEVLDKAPNAKKIPNKEIIDAGSIPVIDQSMNYICGFTNKSNALLKVDTPHIIFGDHTRIVKLINFDYARGADGTQVLISKKEELPGNLLYQMVKDIDLSSYGYARHFKFLKDCNIILPNINVSLKFEEITILLYEKIRAGIFEHLELEKLRDWLLPMLMNGQVRVK